MPTLFEFSKQLAAIKEGPEFVRVPKTNRQNPLTPVNFHSVSALIPPRSSRLNRFFVLHSHTCCNHNILPPHPPKSPPHIFSMHSTTKSPPPQMSAPPSPHHSPPPTPTPTPTRWWTGAKLIPLTISVSLGLLLRFAVPKPHHLSSQSWQLFAIFVTTIAGLITCPLPVGAWSFVCLTLLVITKYVLIPKNCLLFRICPLIFNIFKMRSSIFFLRMWVPGLIISTVFLNTAVSGYYKIGYSIEAAAQFFFLKVVGRIF